jgi:hypothetical protein
MSEKLNEPPPIVEYDLRKKKKQPISRYIPVDEKAIPLTPDQRIKRQQRVKIIATKDWEVPESALKEYAKNQIYYLLRDAQAIVENDTEYFGIHSPTPQAMGLTLYRWELLEHMKREHFGRICGTLGLDPNLIERTVQSVLYGTYRGDYEILIKRFRIMLGARYLQQRRASQGLPLEIDDDD